MTYRVYLKVYVKIHIEYIYIYIYKVFFFFKVICKIFIYLKDNENQLLITKTIILIKNIFNENTKKKKSRVTCEFATSLT